MILRMGNKYRTPGLVLAGFVIFLGIFLLATKNNSLFKASADVKSLSYPDYPPTGYTGAHIDYGNYIDNSDQTSKIVLGVEDSSIAIDTNKPIPIEVPVGTCFNYQSIGNNQYQINTYVTDITQAKDTPTKVVITLFHPTEPFYPDNSTKDLGSGLVSKGNLEFSDKLVDTDLTIHHTLIIYIPTRDCENGNSKSLYRIGDAWKYNPPTNNPNPGTTSSVPASKPSTNSSPTISSNTAGSGVNFIYITNKTNCPNCAAQTTIINSLKKQFSEDVSSGKLTFTDYDYDSHPEIFVTGDLKPSNSGGVPKNQLPDILIKSAGKEIGRYSGYQSPQSQTALASQIQAALNTTKGTSGTSPTITGEDVFQEVNFTQVGCTISADATVKKEYLNGTNPIVKVMFEADNQSKTVLVGSDGTATTTFEKSGCDPNVSNIDKTKKTILYNKTIKNKLIDKIIPKALAAGPAVNKVTALDNNGKIVATNTPANSAGGGGSSTGGTQGGTASSGRTSNTFGTQSIYNALAGLSQNQANGDATGNIYARVASVINLLLAVASAAMAFGVIWSGLLLISSMGNEEQAKKAKSNMVMLLIGLVILLSSFTIVTLIQNVLKGTGISG